MIDAHEAYERELSALGLSPYTAMVLVASYGHAAHYSPRFHAERMAVISKGLAEKSAEEWERLAEGVEPDGLEWATHGPLGEE